MRFVRHSTVIMGTREFPSSAVMKEGDMTKTQHKAGAVRRTAPQNVTSKHIREEIQQLAYTLYCQGGFEHGHDLEHWLEAERQVLTRPTKTS